MFKITTENYMDMLKVHYKTKIPLYVYGGPGIGKSAIPRQYFSALVDERNKKRDENNKIQFVEWSEMDSKTKRDAVLYPENYFVFLDFRLGECDSSDIRGIPKLNNDYTEFMPLSWMEYFKQEKADGAIFFDEMNLAPPIVAGQAYRILNDRVVSEVPLSKNIFLFGAGNRSVDRAQVFDMPFPLKDRFSEVEIIVNDESWIDWSFKNDINSHIIAFVKWKPSVLYQPPNGSEDKGSTPRGFVRASKLIDSCDSDIDSSFTYTLIAGAIGEAAATEFQAYVTVACDINIDKLIKTPKDVEKLTTPDKRYAVCGLIGERIRKSEMSDKDDISGMFGILHHMPIEYCVVGLNMVRRSVDSPAKFKRMLQYYPKHRELISVAGTFAF